VDPDPLPQRHLDRRLEDALIALLGRDASGLSASTIGRLKEAWSEEHARWSKRDLSAKRYIYFWVDGIHVQARLDRNHDFLLVSARDQRRFRLISRRFRLISKTRSCLLVRLLGCAFSTIMNARDFGIHRHCPSREISGSTNAMDTSIPAHFSRRAVCGEIRD